MLRLLIPVVIGLIGAGIGLGAGLYAKGLMPSENAESEHGVPADGDMPDKGHMASPEKTDHHDAQTEFVKLNNQFIVPLLDDGKMTAMVVLSLSIETAPGMKDKVFAREPQLRDRFLQVLFEHAFIGGFDGNFTATANLRALRNTLRDAAQHSLGESVVNVLITDIARQEI